MTQNLIEKFDLAKYIGKLKRNDVIPAGEREGLFKGALGIEKMALAQGFYPTITPDFLSMKGDKILRTLYSVCDILYGIGNFPLKTTTPLFAMYSLTDPTMVLSVTYSSGKSSGELVGPLIAHSVSSSPSLPEFLSEKYKPAIKTDQGCTFEFGTLITKLVFNSTFSGFFPERTKVEIDVAKNLFGSQMYLVAPAEWTLERVEHITQVEDPLVVGVLSKQMFLIDSFDCSPLEEYVKGKYVR